MNQPDDDARAELCARVEALLFAADQPRTIRWMAHFLGTEGKLVRGAVDELVAAYAERPGALEIREVLMNRGRILAPDEVPDEAGERLGVEDEDDSPDGSYSALEVHDDEDPQEALERPAGEDDLPPVIRAVPAYQIAVRFRYRELVQRLLPPELSRPVLGTLSVIAARQPILQADVIRIRGKRAYAHIKELLAQRLILRRPTEGTYRLQTTSEFSRRYQIDPAVAQKLKRRRERQGRARGDRPEGDPSGEGGPDDAAGPTTSPPELRLD